MKATSIQLSNGLVVTIVKEGNKYTASIKLKDSVVEKTSESLEAIYSWIASQQSKAQ